MSEIQSSLSRPEGTSSATGLNRDDIARRTRLYTISFIVPALNEGEGIVETVRQIKIAAETLFDRFEVVLVNDGSTDNTGEVMDRLAAADARVRAVHNPVNLGLGGAYKRGVEAARLDYVIMVPGDNAHPADGLVPILARIGEADIIIPYVINREARSYIRRVLSGGFSGIINVLFGLQVPYFNGLVLHRRELVLAARIETNSFAYQAEALIKLIRRGHSWVAVGTEIAERSAGNTKAFRFRNVRQIFWIVVRLFWTLRILGRR